MYKIINNILIASVLFFYLICLGEPTLFPFYSYFFAIWVVYCLAFAYLNLQMKNKIKLSSKVMLIALFLGISIMSFRYYNNRIFYAVWKGNVDDVKKMVADKWDINRPYFGYYLTEIIFQHGMAISRIDPAYDGPKDIDIDVISGIIKLLVENGADQKNIHLATYGAAMRPLPDVVELLCKYIDINYLPDYEGHGFQGTVPYCGMKTIPLMHFIVDFGNIKSLTLLLELKPDPELKDSNGLNLLEYVNKYGSEEKKKIIIDYINSLKK